MAAAAATAFPTPPDFFSDPPATAVLSVVAGGDGGMLVANGDGVGVGLAVPAAELAGAVAADGTDADWVEVATGGRGVAGGDAGGAAGAAGGWVTVGVSAAGAVAALPYCAGADCSPLTTSVVESPPEGGVGRYPASGAGVAGVSVGSSPNGR